MLELTERDRQICDLLIEAWSNREIAAHLGMTEAAVKERLLRMSLRNGIDRRRNLRVLLAVLYFGETKLRTTESSIQQDSSGKKGEF